MRKIFEALTGPIERRIDQLEGRVTAQLSLHDDRGRRTEQQLAELDALVREVRNDIAATGEQSAKILALSEHTFALTSRLDSDVVAGFARFAEFLTRLDNDLAAGLNSIGTRLETSAAGEQMAKLVALSEHTFALASRLDGDVVAGFAQFAEFLTRLDNDLAAGLNFTSARPETAVAGEQMAKLVALSEHTFALASRLDGDVVAGFAQFAEFLTRLDNDLAGGLNSINTRLATDLVTLARNTHELAESSRHVAGTVGKLAADQIQFADAARQNNAAARSEPAAATAAGEKPPILRLADAELPAAVRKWLAAHDIAPGQTVWCLDQKLLPQTADALPGLTEIMAACRRSLQPGERVVWAQQVEQKPLLAVNEMEQVLGLLGSVQGPVEISDKRRKWRVALATRRLEAAGIVLRWSVPALEALHVRHRPIANEMLERLSLREAAHAVDLPEPDADMENWAWLLPTLVATIARNGVPIGITLPRRFHETPQRMDDALARLRQALRDGGNKDEIALQWVRGPVSVDKSSAILAFAQRHGIGFDLTPVSRGAPGSRLAAYDDRLPYRALAFDLRLPSYAAHQGAVIEIPRWAGRILDARIADGESGLGALFDAEFERSRRRLARVLDRAGQKQFELQANLDTSLVGYWPEHFVYNWSAPAGASLRAFEFDASELFAAASPLNRVLRRNGIEPKHSHFLSGQQLLAASAKVARPVADDHAPKQLQIEAHRYLRDQRPDVTEDAERLIDWMPEQIGITLELGSGFGVMARRLHRRASRYIGFDLTFDQAAELRKLGGLGLVADMQALPFPDAVFDTIVADNVIEHAADPLQALSECRRVLRPGGQAFMAIPFDYLRPEFCNQAHLWKSDEASIREALYRAGLRVVRQETVHLADLGVGGAYPSSDGQTGLWQVEKPQLAVSAARNVEPVQLGFPSCLQEEFGQEFDAAWAATNVILDTIPGSNLTPLARHSPGLANFDWSSYIRLSAIRMVRVGAALREAGLRKGKILDFGSYFGNFSLFARQLGFDVDAADQYGSYGEAFARVLPVLRSAGTGIIDLSQDAVSDLSRMPESSYDAVLCLGVIEHVAHTPKPLLLALNRVLRPGGTLILDAPNLSYLYTRERLASGQPIAAPIQTQFDVEPPFEGHHREYTSEELVWMLQQIGQQDIHVELFNYSVYGLSELRGDDAERFRRMERDPQLRELILTRSTKSPPAKVSARTSLPHPQRPSPSGSGGRKRP